MSLRYQGLLWFAQFTLSTKKHRYAQHILNPPLFCETRTPGRFFCFVPTYNTHPGQLGQKRPAGDQWERPSSCSVHNWDDCHDDDTAALSGHPCNDARATQHGT